MNNDGPTINMRPLGRPRHCGNLNYVHGRHTWPDITDIDNIVWRRCNGTFNGIVALDAHAPDELGAE